MASLEIVFAKDEIEQVIAYNAICTIRYSRIWNTMLRKLRWNEEFTEEETLKAEKIFCQAYKWALGYGIPETVRIDLPTFSLWKKIEGFCMSL